MEYIIPSQTILQLRFTTDCTKVSLLCSLPTIVYVTVSSVVHQVALLLSNNSLQHSEQYCVSGCSTPFLYW